MYLLMIVLVMFQVSKIELINVNAVIICLKLLSENTSVSNDAKCTIL